HRRLAEREQPRYIRETCLGDSAALLDHFQRFAADREQEHAGEDGIGEAVVGDIGTSDELIVAEGSAGIDARGEFALEGDGLSLRDVPTVKWFDVHENGE